jgi:hypothetical protein
MDPAVSEVTRAATQNLWYSGGILLLGVVFTAFLLDKENIPSII